MNLSSDLNDLIVLNPSNDSARCRYMSESLETSNFFNFLCVL